MKGERRRAALAAGARHLYRQCIVAHLLSVGLSLQALRVAGNTARVPAMVATVPWGPLTRHSPSPPCSPQNVIVLLASIELRYTLPAARACELRTGSDPFERGWRRVLGQL